ncbi:MAG: hypothetical protein KDD15_08545 [Lewinella sp.]|nr:hypothetical protein [Lewinella sp.]
MRKILLLSVLILGKCTCLFGQNNSIDPIQQLVSQIDNDPSLTVKEFDATEIYGRAYDGGGVIKVFFNQQELKKIEEEIGLSFGRVSKIIYIEKGMPIKIIDREENFSWNKENTGWDYSKLNEVFQADIYIFDWDKDDTRIMKKGQRRLSQNTSTVFEYEPLIALGVHLWKK